MRKWFLPTINGLGKWLQMKIVPLTNTLILLSRKCVDNIWLVREGKKTIKVSLLHLVSSNRKQIHHPNKENKHNNLTSLRWVMMICEQLKHMLKQIIINFFGGEIFGKYLIMLSVYSWFFAQEGPLQVPGRPYLVPEIFN